MVKLTSKKNILYVTLAFIAVVLVWVSSNQYWGEGHWNNIIKDDGNGYYAYLPAVFCYHDLSFGFFDGLARDTSRPNLGYDYRIQVDGRVADKYFAGTALAQMPFYGMAHLLSRWAGYPQDGYSALYLIFIHVATLFYAMAGLLLLILILKDFGVNENIVVWVLLATVFGTNLFHYIVNEPSMSHVYSFAFVSLFVFCFLRFFRKPSAKYLIAGFSVLGMIFLIRPVNIIVVAGLPFLTGSREHLIEGIRFVFRHFISLIVAVSVFFMFISIQLIIYKIQTGSFIVYSYGAEDFNFTHPHMLSFLLSYRKGYLVYTPMALLAIAGGWYLYKESAFRFLTWLIFLFLVVYVLSSWWMWFYGGSFSQRVMIDYWVFLAIPLGFLLEKNKYRKRLITIIALLIVVCQIQTYQYRTGYIHWSEMNKKRYWDNFLRIDKVIKKEPKEW